MLTGDELMTLVRDTAIDNLEDHLTNLYEMRANELNGMVQGTLGLGLASLAALTVALIQATDSSATPVPLSAILASGLVTVTGLSTFITLLGRLAALRAQAQAAKHLANLLADLIRPGEAEEQLP